MSTEVGNVFSELGAGVFQTEITKALNEIAEKVREFGSFGKQGELNISLKFVPMKDGDQVVITSKLEKKVPAETGHIKQDFNHSTNFYTDANCDLVAYVPETNPDGQQQADI